MRIIPPDLLRDPALTRSAFICEICGRVLVTKKSLIAVHRAGNGSFVTRAHVRQQIKTNLDFVL